MAGAATATLLARRGITAILIERRTKPPAGLGESLPPSAHVLLTELGVVSGSAAVQMSPCHGTRSYWGSTEAVEADYLFHPLGHGWYVNRPELAEFLNNQARDAGATVLAPTVVRGCQRATGGWLVQASDRQGEIIEIECAVIVDATGRGAWFARRQGAEFLYEASQMALHAELRLESPAGLAARGLIEAGNAGWWYSARLPGGGLGVTYYTEADADDRRSLSHPDGWWRAVSQAPHTGQLVAVMHGELRAAPRWLDASSGILDAVHGEGWLAVGDAAMTMDPISSHGIAMALVSARDASNCIESFLAGDAAAPNDYANTLYRAFATYASERERVYGVEQRFADSPYWLSRTGSAFAG